MGLCWIELLEIELFIYINRFGIKWPAIVDMPYNQTKSNKTKIMFLLRWVNSAFNDQKKGWYAVKQSTNQITNHPRS